MQGLQPQHLRGMHIIFLITCIIVGIQLFFLFWFPIIQKAMLILPGLLFTQQCSKFKCPTLLYVIEITADLWVIVVVVGGPGGVLMLDTCACSVVSVVHWMATPTCFILGAMLYINSSFGILSYPWFHLVQLWYSRTSPHLHISKLGSLHYPV